MTTFLFYLSSFVGHGYLVVTPLNCIYGRAIDRNLLGAIRNGCVALVIAIPCLWIAVLGWHVPLLGHGTMTERLLSGHAWVCAAVGAVVYPIMVCSKRWARPPLALVSRTSTTVDYARELGFKPAGRGKHRRIACLPFNEVFQVEFSEKILRLPRLPAAWDGLSIVHLSDFHLCGTPDRVYFQRIMDRCRDWDPDLVALTGDFIDSGRHHRWIISILGRLRWRDAGLACLGNHDYWQGPDVVRKRLRRIGLRVLSNGWEVLRVRDLEMVVIGNEAPWRMPPADLSDCPRGPFRLLLSHSPDNIGWARTNDVDLMLAGHVHGGQVRLPFIGSVFVPSRYGRRYDCGVFHEPPTTLHVSRGLSGEDPLRLWCRPEVTRIVLRRK